MYKYHEHYPRNLKKLENKKPSNNKKETACSARIVGNKIKLRIPNKKLIAKIKRIPGRVAKKDRRGWYWNIPLNLNNADMIVDLGISQSQSFKQWYEERTSVVDYDKHFDIPGLNGELYQFQSEGVQFIESRKGRAIVADDMGLGKTLQSIGYLQLKREEAFPAVIVVPASVKLNWKREIETWMSKTTVSVLNGRPDDQIFIEDAQIYIVNYDILANQDEIKERTVFGRKKKVKAPKKFTGWQDHLLEINPKTLICDECHYLKNMKSKRYKAVNRISKACKKIIMLSGTIIENRPIELYPALEMIDKTLFTSFKAYKKR